MAKPLIEEMLSILTPEQRKEVESAIAGNEVLKTRLAKQDEIYSIYLNEFPDDGDEGDAATRKAEADRLAAERTANEAKAAKERIAAKAAADRAAANGGTSTDISAQLNDLKNALTGQITEMSKKFVSREDLPQLADRLKTDALKLNDDYADIREDHRAEFGEKLNRDEFEKFVTERTPRVFAKDGTTVVGMGASPFKSLKEAHDAFVVEKRTELKIKKGVEDGIKTRKSAETVPGQTTSVAQSPALAVLAKARGEKKTGESNAMAAARKLKDIAQSRDEATVQ